MLSYLKKKLSPHAATAAAPEAAPVPKAKMILLIIDPQVDFHPPHGTLAVPGAQEDSDRTAAFIREHMDDIGEIFVTLDSHHVSASDSCIQFYYRLCVYHSVCISRMELSGRMMPGRIQHPLHLLHIRTWWKESGAHVTQSTPIIPSNIPRPSRTRADSCCAFGQNIAW